MATPPTELGSVQIDTCKLAADQGGRHVLPPHSSGARPRTAAALPECDARKGGTPSGGRLDARGVGPAAATTRWVIIYELDPTIVSAYIPCMGWRRACCRHSIPFPN